MTFPIYNSSFNANTQNSVSTSATAGTPATASVVNASTPKPNQNGLKADTVEISSKKSSTGMKVLIGTIIATGTAIAADFIFAKGKHINKLFKSSESSVENAAAKVEEQLKSVEIEKSKNAGSTVEETIENVLGKDSGITPHTYNLKEEYPVIPVYRNQGGYKDGLVSIDGIVKTASDIHDPLSSRAICYRHGLTSVGNGVYKGNIEGCKNKLVRLELPDPRDENIGQGTSMIMSIVSPNNNYTPLQKDLIKIGENGGIDKNIIDKLLAFKPGISPDGQIIFENNGKYENLDYDLILSAVQSTANAIK